LVAGFDAGRSEMCSELVPAATADHPESWRILLMRARCEARRSDPEAALATLREAFNLGMRQADAILQAEDFIAVVELPEFQVFLEELEARRDAESNEASSG
jgi:hypothetical protein